MAHFYIFTKKINGTFNWTCELPGLSICKVFQYMVIRKFPINLEVDFSLVMSGQLFKRVDDFFSNSLHLCLNKRKRKGLRYIINMHHLNFEYLHMLVYMYVHISNIIFSIYICISIYPLSLSHLSISTYISLSPHILSAPPLPSHPSLRVF